MGVISGTDATTETAQPPVTTSGQGHQQRPAQVVPGLPVFVGTLGAYALGLALIIFAHNSGLAVFGIIVLVVAGPMFGGLFVVAPNEARVVLLFGRYIGSVTEAGWWCANPFSKRQKVSLRVRNFQSERIKVNDASGNPIEIAAVVVWRIADTAKAVFDVADYEQFVTVQAETSLRHLASEYPYDDYRTDTISLRTNTDEVRSSLQTELASRLEVAGVEILETRLTHLAYAPEIAEVMLRRQQAEAILAARTTMVKGAVSLVQMAVAQLADSDLIELDPERKATMVANLMVVLSGDHSPTPVLNTGSLYT